MKFLLACSQGPLEEYRLPELQSIAKLFSFTLTYDEPIPDISVRTPTSCGSRGAHTQEFRRDRT
jgi:hypothetical protein